MIRTTYIIALAFLLGGTARAQSKGQAHDLKRDGDQSYHKQQFDKAEESYRKATIVDPDDKGVFNLGNAIFNQSRYEEAARQYEKAAGLIEDPKQKSKAWYNLGNAHFLNKKYDESVEAFKRSLIADPDDLQAKQNLMMALQEQRIQEQQQQQQQQSQDQEQEEQQQDEQQQQQEQQNQEQQQQQQQSQEGEEQENAQEEQQEQKLSKEQAMQLLEIIDEEDQKVQEKLRRKDADRNKNGKDW